MAGASEEPVLPHPAQIRITLTIVSMIVIFWATDCFMGYQHFLNEIEFFNLPFRNCVEAISLFLLPYFSLKCFMTCLLYISSKIVGNRREKI